MTPLKATQDDVVVAREPLQEEELGLCALGALATVKAETAIQTYGSATIDHGPTA